MLHEAEVGRDVVPPNSVQYVEKNNVFLCESDMFNGLKYSNFLYL